MRFRLGLLVGAALGAAAGFYSGARQGQKGLDRALELVAKAREAGMSAVKRPLTSAPPEEGSTAAQDLDPELVDEAREPGLSEVP
jgi:hypothetical protein